MLDDGAKLDFEFWFEFGSTYSYPASLRLSNLAWRHELEIIYRPFLLGPIFKKQGWDTSPFLIYPAKGAYMWRDMERICEEQEIAFKKPSLFPRNGLLASRIVCAYQTQTWIPKFIHAVYTANFARDEDITSPLVIGEILNQMNLNSEEILMNANQKETKEILRKQTELANAYGIFGAPTFRIGNEIFWGNDRLESAIDWYKKHRNS